MPRLCVLCVKCCYGSLRATTRSYGEVVEVIDVTEVIEGTSLPLLDHLDDLDDLDYLDYLCSNGNGSTGVPSHHRLTSVDRAIAKCRCGRFGGALPVVPTYPMTCPR